MYTLGLSSCGKTLNEELFRLYHEAGIKAMELSPSGDIAGFDTLEYENLKKWAERYDVTLWSYHLPFAPFDRIDISRKELCGSTVEAFKGFIEKGAAIGIDKFIIHPSGEPIEESDRGERMKYAKESLAVLAEFADAHGAVIAVEDLPRTCLGRDSDDIAELISAHEKLAVCFDTNHLLKENPVDFIRKVGKRIVTTHVSDYDFVNERHWLPGEGKVDWQALIGALNEVGYNGAWLYEIGFACPNTILRDRTLICEDFARNARELFDGNAPTVFSKPKPDLGMW